jgi:hypothetical protein
MATTQEKIPRKIRKDNTPPESDPTECRAGNNCGRRVRWFDGQRTTARRHT